MEQISLLTVKVIKTVNDKPYYLYHGGVFRSNILYSQDLNDIDFKKQNMSEVELSREIERVKKLVPKKSNVKVVRLTLDKNMKYLFEEED